LHDLTKVSKMLSLVLRHKPATIGLVLDDEGWADVDLLVCKMNEKGFQLNRQLLEQVVKTNNKKRFAFNSDKTKIRASQGHSIEVDLGYTPTLPPEILFHGTSETFIGKILSTGLNKMNRTHVHLSADIVTAMKVGQRKGKPTILEVASKKMYDEGFTFFVSANGIWLTDHVPPAFITLHNKL
jgi:putative RNA 2'-phosphotransferase